MGNGESVGQHYVVQQKVGQGVNKIGFSDLFAKAADAGSFGTVRRAIDKRTQQPRAIKNIELSKTGVRDRVLHEISMMQAVTGQHANVVEFIEFFEESAYFDLVFEFCSNGTLEDAMVGKKMQEGVAARYSYQLLSALAYIKGRGVLHRDVKPANILLKDEQTSKLADFGSALCLKDNQSLFSLAGTPAFFPPETMILPKGEGYAFPTDMWAAGITIYMLLFEGFHPFVDQGKMDTRLLRLGNFDAGMLWLWNAKLAMFLRWLMMPCPRQRIRPDDAMNHEWLGSHGFGSGRFSQATPSKLVPDSYGRWGEDHDN